MERIDISKIRGNYVEYDDNLQPVAGGNDTVESIRLVAEKVNKIVDWVNGNQKTTGEIVGLVKTNAKHINDLAHLLETGAVGLQDN